MKNRPSSTSKREISLPLRLNEEEHVILEKAAELKGMNVSFFIANCALKHACDIVEDELNAMNKITRERYDAILGKVAALVIDEDD